MTHRKKLEQALTNIDAVSTYFEERGFHKEMLKLDRAADSIQDMHDRLVEMAEGI